MNSPAPHETMVTRGDSNLLSLGGNNGKSCLVKIHPAGFGEGPIELPPTKFIMGRGADCNLNIVDTSVSRQHAYIELRAGNFMIADMGSTNGTFVNDEAIQRRFLASGDYIRIGKHIMKFLSSDHVEAQYHETIYQMMITDGLTGVSNKRFFMDALERELVRSQRHKRPLCLAMFDIDHFKKTNDTNGHLAGDAVLRELCARIRPTIRRDEVFAKYGGEEFAVILPESTLSEAREFGERIRGIIAEKSFIVENDVQIPITISVGVAETRGEEEITAEKLIAAADAKLYEAKGAGRNCVRG